MKWIWLSRSVKLLGRSSDDGLVEVGAAGEYGGGGDSSIIATIRDDELRFTVLQGPRKSQVNDSVHLVQCGGR